MARSTSKGNVYGRQGGRWADGPPRELTDADRAKLARLADPVEAERRLAAQRAREQAEDLVPDTLLPWAGAARHAHARRAAGRPPEPFDATAIDLFPTCPSLLAGELPRSTFYDA